MTHWLARSSRTQAALICALALALSMFAAGMARAQGFGGTGIGTVGTLLDQINRLSRGGTLDLLTGNVRSPLDESRTQDRSRPQGLDETRVDRLGERLHDSQGFRELERLLIRRFCLGELSKQEAVALELIDRFSPMERDYCRRASDVLFLHGHRMFVEADLGGELTIGAISDDYILGIGDEMVLTFKGPESSSLTLRVDREGRLILPGWAPIAAAGRSFGDVRREIEARTATTRLGTEVYVSLGSVRSVAVTVVGEVERPGRQQLTALSSILDGLIAAGGVRKTGSLRRIQVQRGDMIIWFDIYDLLHSGAPTQDLSLLDGDRILVPSIGATVAVAGDVKRPAIYELAEGQDSITIDAVMRLAGGALRPRGNKLMHIAFDNSGRERLIERRDLATPVQNGEILMVARGEDVQLGSVELLGHVRVPGRRSLAVAGTVSQLLGDSLSLRPDPYMLFAALETTDPDTRARRLFPVNLQRVINGNEDYKLRDADRLIILSTEDIRYLSSTDVQQFITRRIRFDVGRQDLNRVDQRGDGQFDGPRNRQDQGQIGAVPGDDTASTLVQQLLGQGPTTQPSDPNAPQPPRQETERERQQRQTDELCAGLLRLAAIIGTTSAERFSGAVRTLDTADRLAEINRQDCPEIFDQYGDLLPLALEHVVAVNGAVRRPGAYPVVGEAQATAVIAVAGGLTREVDLTRVELSRYIPNSAGGAIDASRRMLDLARLGAANVLVGPGDIIRFNRLFTDRDTGPVLLVGEFVRPGVYEIRRDERLSEVIARAGGLTPQAYPYGAVFTRESVRRAQRQGFRRAARELNSAIAVTAVQRGVDPRAVLALQGLSSELDSVEALGRVVIEADPTVLQVRPELDVVLEPGDRLFMPKRPSFVSVIGDVLNPGALQFRSGNSADRYIRQAGGFQASADEDRVFVVFPNGVANPLAVTAWNFNPVQIPPGSTVVVPKDPAPLDLFTLVREGSSLVSQLAVTAASLAVIGRN